MEQEWQSYGGGRTTGVRAFAVLPNAILLRFADGAVYRYDHTRPGPEHVRQMIALAERGAGLTTYVNQRVRGRFASRLFGPAQR